VEILWRVVASHSHCDWESFLGSPSARPGCNCDSFASR